MEYVNHFGGGSGRYDQCVPQHGNVSHGYMMEHNYEYEDPAIMTEIEEQYQSSQPFGFSEITDSSQFLPHPTGPHIFMQPQMPSHYQHMDPNMAHYPVHTQDANMGPYYDKVYVENQLSNDDTNAMSHGSIDSSTQLNCCTNTPACNSISCSSTDTACSGCSGCKTEIRCGESSEGISEEKEQDVVCLSDSREGSTSQSGTEPTPRAKTDPMKTVVSSALGTLALLSSLLDPHGSNCTPQDQIKTVLSKIQESTKKRQQRKQSQLQFAVRQTQRPLQPALLFPAAVSSQHCLIQPATIQHPPLIHPPTSLLPKQPTLVPIRPFLCRPPPPKCASIEELKRCIENSRLGKAKGLAPHATYEVIGEDATSSSTSSTFLQNFKANVARWTKCANTAACVCVSCLRLQAVTALLTIDLNMQHQPQVVADMVALEIGPKGRKRGLLAKMVERSAQESMCEEQEQDLQILDPNTQTRKHGQSDEESNFYHDGRKRMKTKPSDVYSSNIFEQDYVPNETSFDPSYFDDYPQVGSDFGDGGGGFNVEFQDPEYMGWMETNFNHPHNSLIFQEANPQDSSFLENSFWSG
eukprot:Platyproteum_vivax@DN3956_c0_g1_i1.p1